MSLRQSLSKTTPYSTGSGARHPLTRTSAATRPSTTPATSSTGLREPNKDLCGTRMAITQLVRRTSGCPCKPRARLGFSARRFASRCADATPSRPETLGLRLARSLP